MMKAIVSKISQQDNIPVKDVITILRFSLIVDRDCNLREKYREASVEKLWDNIPHKKFWLGMYKDQVRRNRRRQS